MATAPVDDEELAFEYYKALENEQHEHYHTAMSIPSNWATGITDEIHAACINFIRQRAFLHIDHHIDSVVAVAIEIFNRVTFYIPVLISQLHIVALSALWLASKSEAIVTFKVERLIDSTISKFELIRAERFILQTLDYRIPKPLIIYFTDYFARSEKYSEQLFSCRLGYVIMRILSTRSHLAFAPSVLAQSAVEIVCGRTNDRTDQIIWLCSFCPCPELDSRVKKILDDGSEFAKIFWHTPTSQ